MKKFILAEMLIIFFLTGCIDYPPQPVLNEVIPLHFNNYWAFNTTSYDETGNISGSGFDTLKVISYGDCKTKMCFRVGFTSENEIKNFGNISNDGTYQISDDGNDNIYFVKYPVNEGESFSGILGTCTVDSISTNVLTGLGTFECIKYRYTKIEGDGSETINVLYVKNMLGIIEWYYLKKPINLPEHLYMKKSLFEYYLNPKRDN